MTMEICTSWLNGLTIQNQVVNHVPTYQRKLFLDILQNFELNKIDQLQLNRLDFKLRHRYSFC